MAAMEPLINAKQKKHGRGNKALSLKNDEPLIFLRAGALKKETSDEEVTGTVLELERATNEVALQMKNSGGHHGLPKDMQRSSDFKKGPASSKPWLGHSSIHVKNKAPEGNKKDLKRKREAESENYVRFKREEEGSFSIDFPWMKGDKTFEQESVIRLRRNKRDNWVPGTSMSSKAPSFRREMKNSSPPGGSLSPRMLRYLHTSFPPVPGDASPPRPAWLEDKILGIEDGMTGARLDQNPDTANNISNGNNTNLSEANEETRRKGDSIIVFDQKTLKFAPSKKRKQLLTDGQMYMRYTISQDCSIDNDARSRQKFLAVQSRQTFSDSMRHPRSLQLKSRDTIGFNHSYGRGYEKNVHQNKDKEDEPRYCYCNQVSYGEMIGCDNDSCPTEWFHIPCVNLKKAPSDSTRWFCSTSCRKVYESKR